MYGSEKMIRQQKKDADAARRGKDQQWKGAEGEEPEAFAELEACTKCEAQEPGNQMYHSEAGLVCGKCHEG